jgi:hypothetical protein
MFWGLGLVVVMGFDRRRCPLVVGVVVVVVLALVGRKGCMPWVDEGNGVFNGFDNWMVNCSIKIGGRTSPAPLSSRGRG